jgi:hypothetical protein
MEDLGYRWRKRIAPGSLLGGPWVPKCSDDVCAGRDQVVIATTSEGEVVGDWACPVGGGQCHKDMDAGELGRGGGRFLDAPHEMPTQGAGSRDGQEGRMSSEAVKQSRAAGDEASTSSAGVAERIRNDVVSWQRSSVSIASECCV